MAEGGEASVDEDSLDDVQELFSVFTQVRLLDVCMGGTMLCVSWSLVGCDVNPECCSFVC
jgi:hypothetical protein